MPSQKRRKTDIDPQTPADAVDRWWHWIRPYWHVLSFFIIITFIGATQWNNQQAMAATNARDIMSHDMRIKAVEMWQATMAPDIAAIKQEVQDIHDTVVKK